MVDHSDDPEHEMTRHQLFRAADLARALRVARAAGLTVTKVEISPTGTIVMQFGSPEADEKAKYDEVQAALDDLAAKTAARRQARLEAEAAGLRPKRRS